MILPPGISLEWADNRDEIMQVLDRPRYIEINAFEITSISREEAADKILLCNERYIVKENGTPILVTYIKIDQGCALYGLYATPRVFQFPVAYTRATRAFIAQAVLDYPMLRHIVATPPGTKAHRWLNLLGFRDTENWIDLPGGRVLVLEHVNTPNRPEQVTWVPKSSSPFSLQAQAQ